MGAACFMVLAYILYRLHEMEDGNYTMLLLIYAVNFFLMFFFIARYWMIYYTYFSKAIIRAFYVSYNPPSIPPIRIVNPYSDADSTNTGGA
jgi:hypothetical protein